MDVYKQLTSLPSTEIAFSLYNIYEYPVQNAIVNMVQTFFTLTETDILTTLEKIVTQYVKTAIHHMHFSSVTQNGLKSIQAFAVHLQSVAVDCKFIYPNCQHDLSPISIKDQFILGLTSKS